METGHETAREKKTPLLLEKKRVFLSRIENFMQPTKASSHCFGLHSIKIQKFSRVLVLYSTTMDDSNKGRLNSVSLNRVLMQILI